MSDKYIETGGVKDKLRKMKTTNEESLPGVYLSSDMISSKKYTHDLPGDWLQGCHFDHHMSWRCPLIKQSTYD